MKRVIYLVSVFILITVACSKDNKPEDVKDLVSSEDNGYKAYKAYRDSLALSYKHLINDIDKYLYIRVDSISTRNKKNLKALTAHNEEDEILLALIENDKEVKNKTLLTGHKSSLDENKLTRFVPFVLQESLGFAVAISDRNSYQPKEIYMGIPKNDGFTYLILDNSEGQNDYARIINVGEEAFVISNLYGKAEVLDSYSGEYLYDYEELDMEYNYIYSLRKNKTVLRFSQDIEYISEIKNRGFKVSLISFDKHLRTDLPYEKYEHIVYWEHIIEVDDDWNPQGDEVKDIDVVFDESLEIFQYGYEIKGWKYDENKVLTPVSLSNTYTFDKDSGKRLN